MASSSTWPGFLPGRWLADALREIAGVDLGTRKRLELRAAVLTADIAAVQATVRKLVGTSVDYAKARKYAVRVEQAADAIADLTDPAHPSPRGVERWELR